MTAFREMLLNAMEHGAGFDPEKVIEVTAAHTARAIVYHFRDPGGGFGLAELRTPRRVRIGGRFKTATTRGRPPPRRLRHADRPQDRRRAVYNERGNEVLPSST